MVEHVAGAGIEVHEDVERAAGPRRADRAHGRDIASVIAGAAQVEGALPYGN